MYSYYITYKNFIDEYPRFRYALISFDVLKLKIPRIRKWFESEECFNLTDDSKISDAYWRNNEVTLVKPNTIMDIDNSKRKFEIDDEDYIYEPPATEPTDTETQTDGIYILTKDCANDSDASSGLDSMKDMADNLPS